MRPSPSIPLYKGFQSSLALKSTDVRKAITALCSSLFITLLWSSSAWAQASPHRSWSDYGDAGWGYWALALVVLVGFGAFVAWALYFRDKAPQHPSTGRYHVLGSLIVVMTLFTLMLYVIVAVDAQNMAPSDRAWDWKPGEVLDDPGGSDLAGEPYRGYQVYLAQGCTYCHTLYLRPEDIVTGWGEGATADDVSQMADFVNFPFALLGTQRDGPDLAIIGKRIPDMGYQIAHLRAPRQFKPKSVMPNYDYLSDRDLRDLAAFLVSLGNPPAALKSGQLTQTPAPGLDEIALQGQDLYRSLGCVGCHSVDGSANAGPTWKGLYGKTETFNDGTNATVDDDYLIEAITNPGASVVQGYTNFMPPFPQLTDEQIQALLAYIRSLGEE